MPTTQPLVENAANVEAVYGTVVRDPHREALKLLKSYLKPFSVLPTGDDDDLRIHGRIGQGTWSYVYATQDLKSGNAFALKVIPKNGHITDGTFAEVATLRGLHHRNIVGYHGHFTCQLQGAPFLCVKLEFCEKGTLKEYIQTKQAKKAKFTAPKICNYLLQLAAALAYVHRQGHLHGDVRPENILLKENNGLKLGGFASSTSIQRNAGNSLTVTGGCRTYAPPEWMQSVVPARPLATLEVPLPSYDMWGVGCVVSELVTLKLLREDRIQSADALASDNAQLRAILLETRMAYNGTFTTIIDGLLEEDPDERITADEVILRLQSHLPKPGNAFAKFLRPVTAVLTPRA